MFSLTGYSRTAEHILPNSCNSANTEKDHTNRQPKQIEANKTITKEVPKQKEDTTSVSNDIPHRKYGLCYQFV